MTSTRHASGDSISFASTSRSSPNCGMRTATAQASSSGRTCPVATMTMGSHGMTGDIATIVAQRCVSVRNRASTTTTKSGAKSSVSLARLDALPRGFPLTRHGDSSTPGAWCAGPNSAIRRGWSIQPVEATSIAAATSSMCTTTPSPSSSSPTPTACWLWVSMAALVFRWPTTPGSRATRTGAISSSQAHRR